MILTLNEIDGIKKILPQINKSWAEEIVVIDGGSTDGTIHIVQYWISKYPNIKLINNPHKYVGIRPDNNQSDGTQQLEINEGVGDERLPSFAKFSIPFTLDDFFFFCLFFLIF